MTGSIPALKPRMIYQISARTVGSWEPFRDRGNASWIWEKMRARFAIETLAFVLMPNHLHWVVEIDHDRDSALLSEYIETLRRYLGGISSRDPGRDHVWQTVKRPEALGDLAHLKRTIRYTYLNPCRRKLVSDPLAWEWSTYRDFFGAVKKPWTPAERVRVALNRYGARFRGERFLEKFHEYVTSDPSVDPNGSIFPKTAREVEFSELPLQTIEDAALAVFRAPRSALLKKGPTRRFFLQLAPRQGWANSRTLAHRLKIDARSVQREWQRRPDPTSLRAGLLCLGDERLRRRQTP